MRLLRVGAVVGLVGCIEDTARGPDLGACAVLPDGVYGYGEAGIGSCLAGPADLSFFQQDGGTFLAVTNADPFREFRSGSVLVIDWDALVTQLGVDPPDEIPMDQVEAHTLELFDDDDGDGIGDNPFLGGFGYLPQHQAAVVTSRLTENGVLRAGVDDLYVLDMVGMELREGITVDSQVTLEDDPFPVIVDDATERVYVGNLTDHSISVLTSAVLDPPAPAGVVHEVDVAPGPTTTEVALNDADASGSYAEVSRLEVEDGELVTEDQWTLTFIEGTVRAWVPTPLTDEPSSFDGVVRYESATGASFTASPFGFELGLGEVTDPFVELDPYALPAMWYAQSDGDIHRAAATYYGGEWTADPDPVFVGGILGSPSVAPLTGLVGLYADRRDAVGDPASIVLATSADAVTFDDEGPVLVPPVGQSYEDPFVVFDQIAGRYRMWLSVRTESATGDTFEIALTESDDGRLWSTPITVIPSTDGSAAAPTVAVLEGRYGLWYARSNGAGWDHVFAWSYDGRDWRDAAVAIPAIAGAEFDPLNPSRIAIQSAPVGGWRLEGIEQGGVTPYVLTAGSGAISLEGANIELASGHEVENNVVGQLRADQALIPGSAVTVTDGRKLLFGTSRGSGGRNRIVALEPVDGAEPFRLAIDPESLDAMLGIAPSQSASDPVVVADPAGGFTMFFTLTTATDARIVRSSSTDGLAWTETNGAPVLPEDETTFDATIQQAHSIEVLDDGGYRLWYAGSDGSTYRIGSARADDPSGAFTRDFGATTEWRFGTGLPGGFDDSSVSDPMVVRIDGVTHLYYAGNDGEQLALGHAVVEEDGTITRRTDPASDLPVASMVGRIRTFSAVGVDAPVLWSDDGERLELLYAGNDGSSQRIGRASVWTDTPDEVWAEQRFPTSGDTLGYATTRGGPGAQVIELEQSTEELTALGWGMSGMALDSARGFLYVTTKLDDGVFVIDVRNDSNGSFVDSNYLDVEAVIQVDSGNAAAGFRSVTVAEDRGLAYLTMRNPEGLVVIDLDQIPDDDRKDLLFATAVTTIPMQSAGEDAGVDTAASFGGDGMALTDDERMLLVTNFRGNALSVFDLDRGAWGEEVAWLPNLGENPHVVRISPDGRWAVVANYLGKVEDEVVSSTLAIVDLDPSSDRYLEAVSWLVNR
ncbi:MAG: hypothetical protein ABMB14_01075 [Myxococcota bacterium]